MPKEYAVISKRGDVPRKIALIRSTEEGKQSQLKRLRDLTARHKDESGPMLAGRQQAVIGNQNVFEVLVDAVRCCSLGQIINALFQVGKTPELRPKWLRVKSSPG